MKTQIVFLYQQSRALMHRNESLHFLIRILLDINILGASIVHRNIQQDMLLVSFIINDQKTKKIGIPLKRNNTP